jgi:hypothetical protein
MSDAATPQQPERSGQVAATPEAGPFAGGTPSQEPGAGQVYVTPEAGPLASDEALVPPTWREHMQGPILGLDETPATSPPGSSLAREEGDSVAAQEPSAPSRISEGARRGDKRGEEELRQWPPYSGKPVSEVRWEALRYAAPIASQAEKLAIQAVDLSARGLSKLARYLETRRQEREAQQRRERERNL